MEKKTSTNVAIKWAVIYVVTSIIITYIFQFFNINQSSPAKYVSYLPFIIFLLLAQKEYQAQLGGFIKFGDSFLAGFLYSVFGGIMLAIFIYLYLGILSPQVLDQAMESQRQAFADKGLSSDQIEQSMEMGKKYGAIFGAVGTLFAIPILGAIVALIGASIFKKEKAIDFTEQDSSSYSDPTI